MKKISLIALLSIIGMSALQAQKMRLEDADIALNQNLIEDAKKYIDMATEHETTKENKRTYYIRAKVYLRIASENEYKALDAQAGKKGLEAALKCLRLDRADAKRKYTGKGGDLSAEDLMINTVPAAFNYGLEKYQKAGLTLKEDMEAAKTQMNEAIYAWELILNAFPYDDKKEIDKMNLSEITILQYLADAADKIGDKEKSKSFLVKIMEHPKPVSFAFIQAALNEMGAGDTLKSLEYIEKGRKLFPDDKNLITLELMVYQNQGKEHELTDKLTKALEADPGEPNLLFNRATLFDNRARKMNDDIKILLEKGLELKEKLKKTFKPDEQKKIKSEIVTNDAKVNAIKEEQNKLDDLAIADYKKALESNPDFYDAIFNMGAIHFNRAVPLIEEANALPLDKDYDKKYQVLKDRWMKLYEVALEYFLKAEDIKPNDDSLLLNIQSTYAQLGNQTKSMEYKAKRDGL